MQKLTLKQETFCQAYVRLGGKPIFKNEAYIEVFSCKSFSKDKIEKLSDEILKEKLVKKRIAELKKESQNKNKVGAPSKYKPEYNEQVYKLCLLGATDKEIGDFFDVTETTINNWKIEFPQFFESIRTGKKVSDMEVVSSLYKTAHDRTVIEQVPFKTKRVYWDTDGKRCEIEEVTIVEVEKPIPADFRSQQFWLKNRKSDSWRDSKDITSDGKEIKQTIMWNGKEISV